MSRLVLAATLAALACRHADEPANQSAAPAEEPPVALNAEPAVQYPPDLYDRHVEGDVVLRLYADSSGKLVAESTRVAESSGNSALDTAAVRGVVRLRYAPAYRHGLAISTAFLQTVEFRHPASGIGPVAPAPQPGVLAPRPVRSDTTTRVRRDTARAAAPRPAGIPTGPATVDTTRARRDSARVRRDTTPAPKDTTPAPDSTKVRRDST
ncbi:MAG TPA: energy transducer TonB [Gemmatimonadales bacterium]|nr:energy transducer TonB [Gemmatimonadales bacterium]